MVDMAKVVGKGVVTAVSIGGACMALVTFPPVAARLAQFKLPNA